jgi:hypothetical protein
VNIPLSINHHFLIRFAFARSEGRDGVQRRGKPSDGLDTLSATVTQQCTALTGGHPADHAMLVGCEVPECLGEALFLHEAGGAKRQRLFLPGEQLYLFRGVYRADALRQPGLRPSKRRMTCSSPRCAIQHRPGDDMMLDPQADPGRRAWLPCTSCGTTAPLYLLHCDVNLVWVQCSNCLRRWWHDTGVGHRRNSRQLDDVA